MDDIIKDEINNYLKKPVPLNLAESISFDVLQWWKEHKNEFPHLFLLFKKYMHIPATSVPSERIFSLANNIVTKKRSNLLPCNVNIQVFLHHNFKYIPENTTVYT